MLIIIEYLPMMCTFCDMGVVEQVTDAYSNHDHDDSKNQYTT